MRKFIIVGAILAVLGGMLILALLNLNNLVNSNKDYLLAQAEQALGRQISVEEIEVTIWGGIGVRLQRFTVADDPAFSGDAFVRADDLQVNMAFLPLLRRNLSIKRLILHAPVITAIRNKQGQMNFASMGGAETEPGEGEPATAEESTSAAVSLLVSLVDIRDGEVRYLDHKDNTDVQIRHIDLDVEDLSFDQPVAINFAAAVLAEQQNLKLRGTVGPLGSPPDMSDIPIEGEIELSDLSLDTLRLALPQLKQSLPPELDPTRLVRATISVAGSTKALTFPQFELRAAVLAQEQNLKVAGQAGPLGPSFDTSKAHIKGEVEINAVNLATLQRALPQLKESLPQGLTLSGPLDASLSVSGSMEALTFSQVEISTAVFGADAPNLKLRDGSFGPVGRNAKASTVKGDLSLAPVELANLQRFAPVAASLPPGFKASGPASVKAQVNGTLENLALSATIESTSGAFTLPGLFQKPQGVPLVVSTDARVTPKAIALQQTKLQLHTLELSGSGDIGLGKTPTLNLKLDSNRADLKGWEQLAPMLQDYRLSGGMEAHVRVQGPMGSGKTPKIDGTLALNGVGATLPSAPKPLTDLNAKVTFSGDRAELSETVARLGNSQLRLAAQVERFSPLALAYQLSSPELWLADLQTNGTTGGKPEVLKGVKNEGQVGMKDGALSYQGKLSSSGGTVAQIDYTDFQTVLSLVDQVATIQSLSTQAFDGNLRATGRYDMRNAAPKFAFASAAQNLHLTRIFESGLITTQDIEGRVNFDLSLGGSGQQWEQIQRTLQGRGKAEVVDGVLRRVNVAEGVLSGVTGLPGLSLLVSPRVREKYPLIFSGGDTKFDQLKGAVTIGDGKVNVDDLVMAAADWTATGNGWFSFERKVDFNAMLTMSQRLSDDIVDDVKQAKYIVNDQGRVEVPFVLAGTLPAVKPKPDLAYMSRLVQRAAVRKGGEELQKRVLDKLLPPRQEPPAPEGQEGQATEPHESATTPEEELLRKGLDRLFGR